jgi:hypothetical protein
MTKYRTDTELLQDIEKHEQAATAHLDVAKAVLAEADRRGIGRRLAQTDENTSDWLNQNAVNRRTTKEKLNVRMDTRTSRP